MANNNSKRVYIGRPSPVTGAVQTAPIGTTAPADAGTPLTTGWEESGYVSDAGVTLSQSRSTTDISSWGGTVVRTLLESFDGTIKFSELETSPVVMKRMVGADKVTVTPATAEHGEQMKVNLGGELPEPCAWVWNMKDGDRRLRIYVPNGQLTEVGDVTFVHNNAVMWDFTVKAQDDGTGNCIYLFSDDGAVISDGDTDTDTE